jgi:hypothetical protein
MEKRYSQQLKSWRHGSTSQSQKFGPKEGIEKMAEWHLIREPLKRNGVKEGAVGDVGEESLI